MTETPHIVSDVMTRAVVVRRDAPFKEITRTMGQWKVSAVPVLEGEGRVIGVVSEADLLPMEEFRDSAPNLNEQRRTLAGLAKAGAVTAEELMSTPAITVPPDVTLAQAARIMAVRRVKRLLVVDDEGSSRASSAAPICWKYSCGRTSRSRRRSAAPWCTTSSRTPPPPSTSRCARKSSRSEYLKRHLLHQGVYLERIRGDRVLHEALTVGADPLHLALVFNLSHTAASRYATIAQNLLDEQMGVRRDAAGRESGRS
jgi:CBS domain-containing protein